MMRPAKPLSDYLLGSAALCAAAASAERDAAAEKAVRLLENALAARKAVLVCGNGGSAADALHLSAELTGRLARNRQGLNVIPLVGNAAFLTAWSNDTSFESVFARQVEAHGCAGGALIALSTSGSSPSVLRAAGKAREIGMSVIALTGRVPNQLAALSDVVLDVPEGDTPMIQQVHICYYHHICTLLDQRLFPDALE